MASATSGAADFFDRLQALTEAALTHRKRVKRLKREQQARKHIIVDWLEAFLWAACVVLIINQYLVQAYQIPSGSMIDTLLIHDRIFVSKLVYGPELLPGALKLPSPVHPKRNDVIIFESPSYISRGTAFDIAQRVIYMLSLSLIDIDKDEMGRPKAHFLIKRAAAMEGDRVLNNKGEMNLIFAGEDRAVAERDYNAQRGWTHRVRRLAQSEHYTVLRRAVVAGLWQQAGMTLPQSFDVGSALPRHIENDTLEEWRFAAERTVLPHDEHKRRRYYRKVMGWYVPPGRVLPLGDNRDSSVDGRWFGPVRAAKILGQGLFIYWPGVATEDGSRAAPPLDPPPAKRGWGRVGAIR